MDDKLYRVLLKLLDQTAAGKVKWDDASRLTEGEKFRVSFGDAIVELWDKELARQSDEFGTVYDRIIVAHVLNPMGMVVAQQEFSMGMVHPYRTLEKLFLAARSSARRSDAVLDSLLQKLGA